MEIFSDFQEDTMPDQPNRRTQSAVLSTAPKQIRRTEAGRFKRLHEAIRNGNEGAVKNSLEWGANRYAEDSHGNTALHIAAREGQAKIALTLLGDCTTEQRRSSVHSINKFGQTPLHLAALKGHLPGHFDVAKELLSKGADPNACTSIGDTALRLAVMSGEKAIDGKAFQLSPESLEKPIIKLLISHGGKINLDNWMVGEKLGCPEISATQKSIAEPSQGKNSPGQPPRGETLGHLLGPNTPASLAVQPESPSALADLLKSAYSETPPRKLAQKFGQYELADRLPEKKSFWRDAVEFFLGGTPAVMQNPR